MGLLISLCSVKLLTSSKPIPSIDLGGRLKNFRQRVLPARLMRLTSILNEHGLTEQVLEVSGWNHDERDKTYI